MDEDELYLIESTFGDDFEKLDSDNFVVTLASEPAGVRARWEAGTFTISTDLTSLISREWTINAEKIANDYLKSSDPEQTPLYSCLLFLQEYISSDPPPTMGTVEASAENLPAASSQITMPPEDQPICRTLLRSHHLLSTQKRKSILSWCSELRLWGISKVGYPGIIIVEGHKAGVAEFERRIKSLNWLALNVRWQEEDSEDKLGPTIGARIDSSRLRVIEVENVSEVGELMRAAGLEEMFQSIFRIG